MSRIKLFFICLAGGLSFGALFFILAGIEAGYTWFLAGLCFGGGLLFCALFFLAWLLVQKFSKPISFENERAQAKLEENEGAFEEPFEEKFSVFLPYGKGVKQAVCEAFVYLFRERLLVACIYFGKTLSVEFDYASILYMQSCGGEAEIETADGNSVYFKLKSRAAEFCAALKQKGITVENISEAGV